MEHPQNDWRTSKTDELIWDDQENTGNAFFLIWRFDQFDRWKIDEKTICVYGDQTVSKIDGVNINGAIQLSTMNGYGTNE